MVSKHPGIRSLSGDESRYLNYHIPHSFPKNAYQQKDPLDNLTITRKEEENGEEEGEKYQKIMPCILNNKSQPILIRKLNPRHNILPLQSFNNINGITTHPTAPTTSTLPLPVLITRPVPLLIPLSPNSRTLHPAKSFCPNFNGIFKILETAGCCAGASTLLGTWIA